MKILHAAVFDPRMRGQYRDPFIQLKVDEPVVEIDNPRQGHRRYRLVPCGPFFGAEYQIDGEWYDGVECIDQGYSIGILNKLGLHADQMIDVKVVMPREYRTETATLDLVMPVPRVRRLLRQHAPNYVVLVDEQAALRGELKWRVERASVVCYGGAIPRQARCPRQVEQTVVVKETHLPVCNEHLHHMQSKMRKHRATPNGR